MKTSAFLSVALSLVPFRKHPLLYVSAIFAMTQLILLSWVVFSISSEVSRTVKFSERSRWVAVQIKPESTGDATRNHLNELKAQDSVQVEELDPKTVLTKTETMDPEFFQMIQSMGTEGERLLPRVFIVEGVIDESQIEALKSLDGVGKVSVFDSHQSQLKHLFQRLGWGVNLAGFALLGILFMVVFMLSQLIRSDLWAVQRNLSLWGWAASQQIAALAAPGWMMTTVSLGLAFAEWIVLQSTFLKGQNLLGALSLTQSFDFPIFWAILITTGLGFSFWVFSRRGNPHGA